MATTKEDKSPKPKKVVRRREPEEVKARILSAAMSAFASHGFEGASVRKIATEAHVNLSLLLYHFKSKEELWTATMEDAFTKSEAKIAERDVYLHLSASEQLRHAIVDIVRRFADTPELPRLITHEANQISERLLWMHERYLKHRSHNLISLILRAQKEETVRKFDPARLRFAIISMAAVPFSIAGEYQLVTNKSPFSSAEIEKTIELINSIIFIDN